MNLTFGRATDTHQSEGLDELATKGTSTNHEKIDLLEFIHDSGSVNGNLVFISIARWLEAGVKALSLDDLSGKGLEDVEVEPLLERAVLAGLLHDLLGNNATEVGGERGGLVLAELNCFFNNFLVKFSKILGLDICRGSLHISMAWECILLFEVFENIPEAAVKLLGPAELGKIRDREHTISRGCNGVSKRSVPIVELHLTWDLNIFAHTINLIVAETSRVKLKGEGEWSSIDNLSRRKVIDLFHSVNFSQHYIVSLLIRVSFIFMDGDHSFLSFFNHRNNKLLSLFTILIVNGMTLSVINECVSPSSKGGSTDVAGVLLSAGLIDYARIQEGVVVHEFSLAHDSKFALSNISHGSV